MHRTMVGCACLGLVLFCAGCGDLTPPDRKPVNVGGIETQGLDELSKPVKQSPPPAKPAVPPATPDSPAARQPVDIVFLRWSVETEAGNHPPLSPAVSKRGAGFRAFATYCVRGLVFNSGSSMP